MRRDGRPMHFPNWTIGSVVPMAEKTGSATVHAAIPGATGAARRVEPDVSDVLSAGDRRGSKPALTASPEAKIFRAAFASRSCVTPT